MSHKQQIRDTRLECAECMIYYHNSNNLDVYIGDYIKNYYLKNGPKLQPIWNSDSTRITNVIRENVNNKVEWIIDKQGQKTLDYIVKPAMTSVKEILEEYISIKRNDILKASVQEMNNILKKMASASDIITYIETKKLEQDINRYIAPFFYLNRIN